jgi:creatinine amidohydrolase
MMARLDEMTYEKAGTFDEVILPLGSVEQHGLHLPLGTDSLIADMVCEGVASELGIALCPTLSFGFSGEHQNFPGTIDLGLSTYMSVVERIIASLERSFDRVYLINFHGGNSSALEALLKELLSPKVHLIHFWRAAQPIMLELTDQKTLAVEHAGEFETSLVLHQRPDLIPEDSDRGPDQSIPLKGGRTYLRGWMSEEMTPTGSFGGARWASAEKGGVFLARSRSRLVEIIDEIRREGTGAND